MKKNLLKTGSIVFVLIILGKIFSLIREMYFSALFGTSLYADAYFTANIIPNLLNTPLTISSLVFFVPLYTKCKTEHGEKEAGRFTSNLMTIYVLFNIILTVVAFALSPVLIRLIASGYDEATYQCTVHLSQLLVFTFPVTVAVHVLINVSNANQKHYAPQLLTVFNSIISIVCMYFFVPVYGIYAVPVIGLFAWFVQLFIQGFCIRREYNYRFCLNLRDPLIKSIIVLAIPVVIATATEQINLSIDNMLCSSLGTGAVSVLNYSQKLFNLLNGTITTAIITVSYPVFSRLYAERNEKDLGKSINKYYNLIVLVMLPVMLLCIIYREEIVRIVFARGAFGESAVVSVARVFMIYAIAIPFAALKELITRLFYVYEESKIPMLINTLCIVMNTVLSFIFVWIWKIEGDVLATVIATSVACVFETIVFRRKYAKKNENRLLITTGLWRYILAIAGMSLGAVGINYILDNIHYILRIGVGTVISLVIYAVILEICGEPNVRKVIRKIGR